MVSKKITIVDSSGLQFSTISLGVGGADFDKMEYLDCPGTLLLNEVIIFVLIFIINLY